MEEKENLIKACYIPLSSVRRAVSLLEAPIRDKDKRCKRNLALLQQDKSVADAELRLHRWRIVFHRALRRAIYAHQWGQVAYILKLSPIWEHEVKNDELHTYVRALTILLMNHPSAKSQSLLNDYAHMVLACRSLQDKKALYKSILCLTKKLYGRRHRG